MNDLHLRDLIGGVAIPIILFLSALTLPKWGPRILAWWDSFVWRAGSPVGTNASPGTEPVMSVREQQNQVGADQSVDFENVLTWVSEHNVTDDQALEILAKLQRGPDDYIVSANKIRDSLGGSRDEVLSRIAARRPRVVAKVSPRLERPPNGWRSAS